MVFALAGQRGLEKIRDACFTVVVSDFRMPTVDGVALLNATADACPETTCIMLSGDAEAEVIARSVPALQMLLSKPCDAGTPRGAIECGIHSARQRPNHALMDPVAMRVVQLESASEHVPNPSPELAGCDSTSVNGGASDASLAQARTPEPLTLARQAAALRLRTNCRPTVTSTHRTTAAWRNRWRDGRLLTRSRCVSWVEPLGLFASC